MEILPKNSFLLTTLSLALGLRHASTGWVGTELRDPHIFRIVTILRRPRLCYWAGPMRLQAAVGSHHTHLATLRKNLLLEKMCLPRKGSDLLDMGLMFISGL